MTVRYAVTFEFDTRPPMTHRGTVAGGRAATCVARAAKQAQKTLKPVNWTSVVCVLLERLDEVDAGISARAGEGDAAVPPKTTQKRVSVANAEAGPGAPASADSARVGL
jgi:hypothetical protein